VNASPVAWDSFEEAFLDNFSLQEPREAKVEKFVGLKQGTMSMKEYDLKFTQ